MKTAKIPENEAQRLRELRKLGILDTPAEEDFDDVVSLASVICETPISVISLIDEHRQWFKSRIGLDAEETSRDLAFCAHTILQDDLMIVPDATQDERFIGNGLVTGDPNIRFYAGMPLLTNTGYKIGTLCVIDRKPNKLSDKQQKGLRLLARHAVKLLELRQSNLNLSESEGRNRIFVEQAPTAIAMFDTNMKYMAASGKWVEDYNLIGKEIMGRSHYEIFPEIGEDWRKIHKEALKGKINTCDEAPFERADGSVQWITWDVRPWYIREGQVGGLLMFTADITSIKEKEAQKEHIEQVLKRTNEIARIGAWELDLITNRVKWSKIVKDIHEVPVTYEPPLAVALNFFKEGENRTLIKNAINEALESDKSFDLEVELTTAKGNDKWIRIIGEVGMERNRKLLYGMIQDIDMQKRTQDDLLVQERQFRGAFENSAIGMALVSIGGKWLKVNKNLCDFLGYTKEELLRTTFQEITHPNDLELDMHEVRKMLAGEIETYQLEKRYIHKNESIVWGLLSVSLVKDKEGRPLHFVSQIEDITKRKYSEEKLVASNLKLNESKKNLEYLTDKLSKQNAQLANFAHITSHNLRSPVSNLNSLLNIIRESPEEEKEIIFEKFAKVVTHLSDTLEELSEALRIQDQSQSTLIEELNFKQTFDKVKEMISSQITESGAEVISDFSKAPTIQFNKSYLESIFLNLLTNAIKYRSEKRKPLITIETKMNDNEITLTVKDNGKGIDLGRHGKKLFGLHKTFHRNTDSRGVGLFLTRTQVESMGGRISANSEVNKGSEFSVSFNPNLIPERGQ